MNYTHHHFDISRSFLFSSFETSVFFRSLINILTLFLLELEIQMNSEKVNFMLH